MKKLFSFLVFLFLAFPLIASPAWAQEPPSNGVGSGITNPVIGIFGTQHGDITLATIIASLLKLALVVAGLMLLLYLVVAGLQWLGSGGEKASVAAARDRITNAVIGLTIVALVIVIIAIIQEIFEIDILRPELPTPE